MAEQNRPSAFPGGPNSFPRLDAHRKEPIAAAVTEKLVENPVGGTNLRNRQRGLGTHDLSLLQKVLFTTSNNITATASLMQMLPDMQLAMQILVSSILSPKDMVKTQLNFWVEHNVFDHELAGPLLDVIRTYFDSTYKISDMLPKILEDTLFHTGSYAMVVLPENTIDEAINSPDRVTVESIRDQLDADKRLQTIGILGNKPTETTAVRPNDTLGLESMGLSLEDYRRNRQTYRPDVGALELKNKIKKEGSEALVEISANFESYLTIHDNPNVLKFPRLKDKMQQDLMQDLLASQKLGIESSTSRGYYGTSGQARPVTDQRTLYRRRRYKHQPVLTLKTSQSLDKKAVGHPLVMHLPSESVIPVHVPSNPEEHLGYFVLLDEQGNPLVRATETDYYRNMGSNLLGNDVTNRLISKTNIHVNGIQDPLGQQRHDVEQMNLIYADIVEEELTDRLKNGVYGDGNVQVARPQEVYRIMFARALVKMRTQVLYVPAEMMTYFAFDYNETGVGESLMQKSKIIGGMRVMLSFANTMAALKNSVGRTKLGISLDPADDDPTQTVEFIVHEHAKLRQGAFPLGVSNPTDIIGYLQNAAMELEVTGNTAYPETKVLLEDIQGGRIKPDTELEESLKKRHLMSVGVSPETVDAGSQAEFAQAIIQNNLLLSKRVLNYQTVVVGFTGDFVRLYTHSSGYLMKELLRVVEENRTKARREAREYELEPIQDLDKEARRAEEAGDHRREEDEERPLESHPQYGRRREDSSTKDARDTESDDNDVAAEDEDELSNEDLVALFIEAIRVSLPAPDTSTLANQMKAYDEYADALDKALKAYLDTEFITDKELGELEPYLDSAVKAVRAHYLRQWLRNNNVMSELDDLTTYNDQETPALDLLETHEHHVQGIGKTLLSYLKATAAYRQALDKATQSVTAGVNGASDTGGDGGNDTVDTNTGDDGGEIGSDPGADPDADTGALPDTGDIPGLDDIPEVEGASTGDDGADATSTGSEGGKEGGVQEVKPDADKAKDDTSKDKPDDKPAE